MPRTVSESPSQTLSLLDFFHLCCLFLWTTRNHTTPQLGWQFHYWLMLCALSLSIVNVHWYRNSDGFLTIFTFWIGLLLAHQISPTRQKCCQILLNFTLFICFHAMHCSWSIGSVASPSLHFTFSVSVNEPLTTRTTDINICSEINKRRIDMDGADATRQDMEFSKGNETSEHARIITP